MELGRLLRAMLCILERYSGPHSASSSTGKSYRTHRHRLAVLTIDSCSNGQYGENLAAGTGSSYGFANGFKDWMDESSKWIVITDWKIAN